MNIDKHTTATNISGRAGIHYLLPRVAHEVPGEVEDARGLAQPPAVALGQGHQRAEA